MDFAIYDFGFAIFVKKRPAGVLEMVLIEDQPAGGWLRVDDLRITCCVLRVAWACC
jgi:hypothetical protein